MDCMEKNNNIVSLELTVSTPAIYNSMSKENSDASGKYSSNHQYQKNTKAKTKAKGCDLSLQLSLGYNSQKRTNRSRVQIKKRNNNGMVWEDENVSSDPWTIKKKLCGSDVGRLCRLTIGPKLANSHIFPFWNADELSRIKEGLPVAIWDCDTNTEHDLNFKQWNRCTNGFIKNWSTEFVRRRELKMGDEIGLYWDKDNSRFNFSLLNRVAE